MSDFTPAELYSFVAIGGAACALALVLKSLFRREPPLHREFVARTEHEELKARVDRIADDIAEGFARLDAKRSSSVAGLHDDLEDAITGLQHDVKDDIKGVHNRINEVLAAVARLEGRLDS